VKRKVNFYILFIVLLTGLLLSFTIVYNVKKQLKSVILDEKENVVNRILEEYSEFDNYISYLQGYFAFLYKDRIIDISKYLNGKWINAKDVPIKVLADIIQKENISDIYLLDKHGYVVKTTNNSYNKKDSTQVFNDVFKVSIKYLDTDNVGVCSYYHLSKSNYIIKTVTYIDNKNCRINSSFLLNDMLYSHIRKIPKYNQIIQNIDLFKLEGDGVSLLYNNVKTLLKESERTQLLKDGLFRKETKNGERIYSIIDVQSKIKELSGKLILFVDFNYSNRYYFARHITIYIIEIILILLLIVSITSPIFIDKFLFKKIDIINYNLSALRFARYNSLKKFDGNDELSNILENIEYVKESVLEREEQLVESKELVESANKLKSAFLANMSHEIRTPLNAVVGFAQLLRDVNPSPEDTNRYVELINSNSNKLLQIINDIIDLSQIESGLIKIVNKTVCLNELFTELYALSQNKLYGESLVYENKKMNIILDIKPSVKNLCMVTDYYRLKQIMEQLIDNAIKFSCDGEVIIGYSLKSNYVEFFVGDNGIGIAEDNVKKIFDRFVQIEDYMTREYGGTGLGLAICKELTRMMGGSIRVKSKLNEGSLFTVKLPYVEPKC